MRICFAVSGGAGRMVDEHGIARAPGLQGPPGFNLEEELARADRFVLEPAGRSTEARRELTRAGMEALLGPNAAAGGGHEAEE